MKLAPLVLAILISLDPPAFGDETKPTTAASVDYARDVAPILTKYCVACHQDGPDGDDAKGELILSSHEALLRGGESGAAIVPGKSEESLLIALVEERRKPKMPPGKRKRPSKEEITILKRWIDAGARASATSTDPDAALTTPRVATIAETKPGITSITFSPDGTHLAIARHGAVEVHDARTRAIVHRLDHTPFNVNVVRFSPDGRQIVAAGGEPGRAGRLWIRDRANGKLLRSARVHDDTIYALAVSPDGLRLVTGSYDQTLAVSEIALDAPPLRIAGHNGAVYALDFRKGGRVFASAGADRTAKLWSTESGKRLETFSQPFKELSAVVFSPDGQRVIAAGADNRLRVWRVSESAAEGTNPLILSRFAHERRVLALAHSRDGRFLASSASDRTVKVWTASTVDDPKLLERQPDWPSALAFSPDGNTLAVARLDGSFELYDSASGERRRTVSAIQRFFITAALGVVDAGKKKEEPAPAPPKPELRGTQPRGVRLGHASKIRLEGAHIDKNSELRLHGAPPEATGRLVHDEGGVSAEIEIPESARRGSFEVSVAGAAGESGKVRVWIDDVAQAGELEPNDSPRALGSALALPRAIWGAISERGDVDTFAFEAEKGRTVILDLEAQRIGSKLDATLTLLDTSGRVAATSNDFDGSVDPFLAYEVPAAGRYTAIVRALELNGSREHHYRLSIGAFAFVTACHPLSVPKNAESAVELSGYNLAGMTTAKVQAGDRGEVVVPLPKPSLRWRRALEVLIGDGAETLEAEPNDAPDRATAMEIPGAACGRIEKPDDADLFRIRARAGERLLITTNAARRGSPIDTRIDVLHTNGAPVERVLLRATRDSAITFRPIDAATRDARVVNWEEMELNELLYLEGEVVKLFRAPQGPDSGFQFYAAPNGNRRCYFDTSPTTHALDSPCYTVVPHPPGTKLVPNGLPEFRVYFSNDDDGGRSRGRDSRLLFDAPKDGEYLVRVKDAGGGSGDRFVYRLEVRPAKPDFSVRINGRDAKIPRGSGKGFSVVADRSDGFEGEIRLDVEGVPPGFRITSPLLIEAGHRQAKGTIWALEDAADPSTTKAPPPKLVATATIGEVEHRREIGDLGKLSLTGTPKLRVYLEPWGEAPTLPPSVREDPRTWTVLAPSGAVSVAGAKLRTLEDASILAEGAPAETDTYTIAATSKLEKIRALRLEALSHASLPHGGPGRAPENGNFVLSQLTVTAAPIGHPDKAIPVKLSRPRASFAQAGFDVARVLDGNPETGWAVAKHEGDKKFRVVRGAVSSQENDPSHVAIFELDAPVGFPGGTVFVIRLAHSQPGQHVLGRMRFSVSPETIPEIPPTELTLTPGETIPARLRVVRRGFGGLVTFAVDNLPHGVIVDNIGLNGVLLPAGENKRQVFLKCAPWVEETSRPCHAVANQEGKPTSAPAILHIRRVSTAKK